MGGLYSLTQAAIQGLKREHWGSKTTGQDGTETDSGVQDFADELLARLASNKPIQMTEPLTLIAPQGGGPAIQIITQNVGDGGITVENINNYIENITNENVTNVTNVTNITEITSPPGGGGGSGFTGSVNVLTDVSVSVSSSGSVNVSGCSATLTVTNTVTITKSYATITFSGGVVTGAS